MWKLIRCQSTYLVVRMQIHWNGLDMHIFKKKYIICREFFRWALYLYFLIIVQLQQNFFKSIASPYASLPKSLQDLSSRDQKYHRISVCLGYQQIVLIDIAWYFGPFPDPRLSWMNIIFIQVKKRELLVFIRI